MQDLITTVQQRYARIVSYRGLSTLVYHERTPERDVGAVDAEENNRRGFLGFLRPQLQSISKKLHDEVNKILERRNKTLLQTVTREMPQIIGKNTAQFRSDSQKFAKTQTDKTLRLEKRVDLITADTGAKLKAVQRELDRLKSAEKARVRAEERMIYERPIQELSVRRSVSREIEHEREELRREISVDIAKTQRRITRKLRDDEEYEKRRRS